ncbi:hypothetical protein CBR_g50782 [Chara braunii]|uniref:Reverse transcriptase domain-containing protein n=1 Tax=Chara braunii TaxID=69332 RepID=A0A388K5U3_CHABU|nr:hypothetical protein CBR_g50782 [Chara braunii]|eukprot:GBG65422.1 hypothetical protein CBR_g50782 [Chara braunii]
MYKCSTTSVLVNGKRSRIFALSRSLRQGCPLALLTFVLQIEVALNTMRASPRIFALSRSLRQGCPLAPLLFVLKIEVALNAMRASPLIRGLQLRGPKELRTGAIADDLMLVSEATPESMNAARTILDQYSTLSEAKVNWDKSVYFLPEEFDLEDDWTMKRVKETESERYLGVQVSLTNGRLAQEAILTAKVEARAKRCHSTLGLSLMGRATVISTSIFSLIWHIATVILISRCTLQKIRRAAAQYLWKPEGKEGEGFISKVAWDKVTLPKREGGLGIIDPEKQNVALLGKWIQKACTQSDRRSWVSVVEYVLQQEFKLKRSEDVWTCLQLPSFLNRRPKSSIVAEWWIAWKKLRSATREAPSTREDVLGQPLFENTAIIQADGSWFSAAGQPGNFGRLWVEKGISKVADIWSDDTREWKSDGELRRELRRVRGLSDKLERLTEAIPKEWERLLREGARPQVGGWYKKPHNGTQQHRLLKVEEELEAGKWKVSKWAAEKESGNGQKLHLIREMSSNMDHQLTAVRVIRSTVMKLLPSQALLLPEASATQVGTSALTRQVVAAVGSQCWHRLQSEPPWPCGQVDAQQSVRRSNHSVVSQLLQGRRGVLSSCLECCPSCSRRGRFSDGYSIGQQRLVLGSKQTESRRRPLCRWRRRCVKDRGNFAHDQSRLNASPCIGIGAIGLTTQRAAWDDSPNLPNGESTATQKLERYGRHSFVFLALGKRWGEALQTQAAREEKETRSAAMTESVCGGGTVAEQSRNSTLPRPKDALLHGYQVAPPLVCISAGVLIFCCLLASPGSAPAEAAEVSGTAAEWASLGLNAQQGLDLTWSILGAIPGLDLATEPANALSLPTWVVHVSSVLEWWVSSLPCHLR